MSFHEEYYNKLSNEYLQSILTRIDHYINESIYTRQKKYFSYLKNNYYWDMQDERNENFAKILSSELTLNVFNSKVLNHQSLYNNTNEVHSGQIQKFLNSMSRFFYFEQFFFWMKDYVEVYTKTMTVLLKNNGCLSIQWKFYIALMSVCTMKNEFLFRVLEEEFLGAGGDEAWLILGLDVVPNKLKQMSLLNSILAHQPWKLQVTDITKLKSFMNVNELIEGALIMIQFHKLALIEENLRIKKAFTEKSLFEYSLFNNEKENYGDNGNNHEIANENNHENKTDTSKQIFEDEIDKETQADLIKLMEEMQIEEDGKDDKNTDEVEIRNISSKQSAFKKITIKQESFHSIDSDKDSLKQEIVNVDNMFNKHSCSENQQLCFKGPHKEIICTYLNFNWCDNGIYTLQYLHQTGVTCLDEEIEYITSLNSKSLGQINNLISTSPIRRAINHYIESLFGYYHEDYNYENITKLLEMKIKYTRYIKKITCFPKRLSNDDLKDMAKVFTKEEVVHIILLAALVKSKIQLVYLAKAINDVMKSID